MKYLVVEKRYDEFLRILAETHSEEMAHKYAKHYNKMFPSSVINCEVNYVLEDEDVERLIK